MEHLTPSELQKLFEDEATTLHAMHSKISNQIHLLQVEEELFRQELEKLQREGTGKDYPKQAGVNQIVEVTNADAAEEGNNSVPMAERAEGVKNIVEIGSDDLAAEVTETPEVPQEKGEDGVNQIVEITGDEDEIMRESNSEVHMQASTSSPSWSEQHRPSNLEYQILEPSSDESETDVEDLDNGKKRMALITFPWDTSRTVVGEKRQRSDGRELSSNMEVEGDSDAQRAPAVSPASSPPRKKRTPGRKAAVS